MPAPDPDLQPVKLVIIVRLRMRQPGQLSCKRTIVRLTPRCPAYPGTLRALLSGIIRTIVRSIGAVPGPRGNFGIQNEQLF